MEHIRQRVESGSERQAEGRRILVRKYWHACLFLGFLIEIFIFGLLEKHTVPLFWIRCPLDSMVPFVPAFVLAYLLWFPMIAVVLIYFCFHNRGDFVRTISLLYAGMATAIVICTLFPHGQTLRPIITEKDVFSLLVRNLIYANDTNTNCCPSIHVLNQVALHIGICKSRLFRNRKGIKRLSLVLTVLVCASTCLIKQHSVVDVALALTMEIPLYALVFKVNWGRFVPAEWKARIQNWEMDPS